MLFADSERVFYEKNPLVEVICQFRFPTILRIREGALAGFHEMIRKDYPVYSEHKQSFGASPRLPKELAAIIDQMSILTPPDLMIHRFSTRDSMRFISLRDEFMALTEKTYEKWELFREQVVKAENALREVHEPAFYSRVGLRYRDVISRSSLGLAGVKWQDLLQTHIVAELGDTSVSDVVQGIQTRVTMVIPGIPNGQIALSHGLITPSGSDEDCYLIDADFSVERKEGVDETLGILDEFNRMAGRLFRWAIRERLHNAMQPRVISP